MKSSASFTINLLHNSIGTLKGLFGELFTKPREQRHRSSATTDGPTLEDTGILEGAEEDLSEIIIHYMLN
jgi:hypothetical protein